jgi:hypothetical protein
MTMKCLFEVPVPIRPIAYNTNTHDHAYIFVAGGSYYLYHPEAEHLSILEGEVLRDDNVLKVGWVKRKLDEVEDGIEKLNNLQWEQEALMARKASTD